METTTIVHQAKKQLLKIFLDINFECMVIIKSKNESFDLLILLIFKKLTKNDI